MHRCDYCHEAARYYMERYDADPDVNRSCINGDHLSMMVRQAMRRSLIMRMGTYTVPQYRPSY